MGHSERAVLYGTRLVCHAVTPTFGNEVSKQRPACRYNDKTNDRVALDTRKFELSGIGPTLTQSRSRQSQLGEEIRNGSFYSCHGLNDSGIADSIAFAALLFPDFGLSHDIATRRRLVDTTSV
jgi:hypothetical protein